MKHGRLETLEQREEAIRETISELGLKKVPKDLIGQLAQTGGMHFSHSIAVAIGVKRIMDGIGPITAPSMKKGKIIELDKSAIVTGALLHDIGKFGPPGISYKDGRNPFAIVYGLVFSRPEFMEIAKVDSPKEASPSKIKLIRFLNHIIREKNITREEAELILRETRKVINREKVESITLRDFYNAHVIWTRQHLNRSSIHQDTWLASGGHHAARRFRFPNTDDKHSDEHVIKAGKWVEVVDSIQAVTGRRERGRELVSFEKGLEGVRRMVNRASGLFRVVQDGYHEILDDDSREKLDEKLAEEHERDMEMGIKPKRPAKLEADKVVRTGLLEEALTVANESVLRD